MGDRDRHESTAERVRVVARVHGDVQGVGFRWWTRSQAGELGLAGSATNLPDGTVEVVLEGAGAAVEDMLSRVRGRLAPGVVDRVDVRREPPRGARAFDVG